VILKEGSMPRVGSSMYIEHLDSRELQPLMEHPPPGAHGFFIGDLLGGSGWQIELPDGSVEKYYVALPADLKVTTSLHFDQPPATHAGQPLEDTSIEALSTTYHSRTVWRDRLRLWQGPVHPPGGTPPEAAPSCSLYLPPSERAGPVGAPERFGGAVIADGAGCAAHSSRSANIDESRWQRRL
jgi:hypothetical protein